MSRHITHTIRNISCIFSPNKLVSLINFISKSPGSNINAWEIIHTWFSVLLPCLFILLSLSRLNYHPTTTSNNPNISFQNINKRALLSTILSPLTIGTIIDTYPKTRSLISRLIFFKTGRIPCLPEAQTLLQHQINDKRAYRNNRYDIFLPPPDSIPPTHIHGLVILPGFLVDHTSYGPLAAKLADEGIPTIVLSMEPFRIAAPGLGANLKNIDAVVKKATSKYFTPDCHVEWNIGGHSLGAYAALRLSKPFRKIVVWGAGNFSSLLVDLSATSKKVLAIQGSEDRYARFSKEERDVFVRMVGGRRSKHITVKGGTHAGFAHYESDALFDGGTSPATRERQQKMVVRETLNFLKRS